VSWPREKLIRSHPWRSEVLSRGERAPSPHRQLVSRRQSRPGNARGIAREKPSLCVFQSSVARPISSWMRELGAVLPRWHPDCFCSRRLLPPGNLADAIRWRAGAQIFGQPGPTINRLFVSRRARHRLRAGCVRRAGTKLMSLLALYNLLSGKSSSLPLQSVWEALSRGLAMGRLIYSLAEPPPNQNDSNLGPSKSTRKGSKSGASLSA